MEGTSNYLLQLNYLSSQSTRFYGRKTTFGHQSPTFCFKHCVGGLGHQSHTTIRFNHKSLSDHGTTWKRNAVGKVSNSLQSVLKFIVYDASSDLKSRFSSALQGHASAKRAIKETIAPLEPIYSKLDRNIPINFAVGLGILVAFMVIALRGLMARQPRDDRHGSVSDLVKRGQLRSDRRIISRPLKYDDPFNNPLVKAGERNSIVKMCGKIFRLTPVTLTEEKVLSHQNRRIRAYQWKRPTLFLKEGDPIPPGVDPDTVRWIPANHPFATASNDMDEDFVQKNIYQKRGVPSRVRAEHEALQRKMAIEATQNECMSNRMADNSDNSESQSKPSDSLEKASDQPNGDAYNGDIRRENREGDSSGSQTFEEKVFEDPDLRSVNHTTQFLDSSESHRLSKASVQQIYFEDLPNN